MKSKKIIYTILLLAICLTGLLYGCKKGTIEIYAQTNIYNVKPGEQVKIMSRCVDVDKTQLEFIIEQGGATIDNKGNLKVNDNATVGSTIIVYAHVEDIQSEKITFTVVDIIPTAISLTADEYVAKGSYVDLAVEFTPSNSTLQQYTLAITESSSENIATISGNRLTLTETAVPGDTLTVRATSTYNAELFDEVTITVLDSLGISDISVDNVEYVVQEDATKYLTITAYDIHGDEYPNIPLTNYSFVSDNENIVTVDNDGKLVAHGHGEANITVKIKENQNITKVCKVYVMIAPTELTLNGVSNTIISNKEMSYSKVDTLKLDIDAVNTDYACSEDLVYSFEELNSSNQVVATGASVATYEEATGITFKKRGKVRVTVKSNSSLHGVDTSANEAKLQIIVNVNEGVNIDTIAEFVAYAGQYETVTANIIKDLYLTENENFGKDANNYHRLNLLGDRIINGNGYVLSNERLPLIIADGDINEGIQMLYFSFKTANTPFFVRISDLEIKGCGGVNGIYTGELEAYKNLPVVNISNGKYIRTYSRGIEVYGAEYKHLATNGKAYVKDFLLDNVKVSGFNCGLRIGHVVDGVMTDINVSNCFSNAIEFNQNTMTLNNVTLGKVGAFGIEMTPDDFKDKTSATPKGTAGANYDETPSLHLTGFIKSDNYTNGGDTIYMQALSGSLGMTVPQLIEAINAGLVDYATSSMQGKTKENAQTVMHNALNACLKNDAGKMNFYLLIFVDPTSGMTYPNGNKEKVFAEYTTDSELGNMINTRTIIEKLLTEPSYDGYKQYKYIAMDLDTGSQLGNLGQVILVNDAYDPNYVPAQN